MPSARARRQWSLPSIDPAKPSHVDAPSLDARGRSRAADDAKGFPKTTRVLERATAARFAAACFAALGTLLAPQIASGQPDPVTPYVIDRFEPSLAGDAFAAVPSAGVEGMLHPAASLTILYARSPLVLRAPAELGGGVLGSVISYELLSHAQASVEILSRVKLDIDAPFTIIASGSDPTFGGHVFYSPSGTSMRDIRVAGRVELIPQVLLLPSISLTLAAWMPTGNPFQYASAGVARYAPGVAIGGDYKYVVYAGAAAIRFQEGKTPLDSEVQLGAAAALRFWRLSIGPELFGTVSLVDTKTPSNLLPTIRYVSAFEALVTARLRLGAIAIGASFGPGLSQGPGTPAYRGIVSVILDPDLGPLGRGTSTKK